jgi:DNA-binding GntR family transcriptional regulator
MAESRKLRVTSLDQQSLSERATQALAAEIISGRMAPGARLELSRFAETWDISITPLREAAKQLESIGLIQILPRKGIFVSKLSDKEITDIFNLRLALETLAIRLATTRIPAAVAESTLSKYISARSIKDLKKKLRTLAKVDALVHNLAYEYCDSVALQKVMDMTNSLFEWSRNTIISDVSSSYLDALDEHIKICEAIVAGDPERAADQMRSHLESALARYLKHYVGHRER